MRTTWKTLCSVGLVSSVALFGAANADDDTRTTVHLSKPKLSKPLSELAKPLPQLTPARKHKMQVSGEKVPGIDKLETVPNRSYPFAKEYLELNKDKDLTDKVLQYKQPSHSPLQTKLLSATIGTGFDGVDNVQGVAPPDTNADVGPNHIVQTVNTALGIWDKDGNELLAPTAINALWAGFGGLCESTNRGDPIVLYDSQADRWLISQFAFPAGFTDNRQCIAISQTGDPTGAYHLYDFPWDDTKFNDYPHYGVWTDGYYSGVNQFTGNSFTGSGVVAYERDKMISGQPAQQVQFDLETTFPNAFTPMPADIDGIFLPPTDMPAPFVTADDANELNVWHFEVDWTTPSNSTFTLADTLAVAPYNGAVCGFSRDCIAQPNAQRLDSIGQRMMFRLAYRNLNGQSKLIATHTVVGSDTDTNIAGVRWYEIDLTDDGMPSLANNGTYNLNDGNSRWMGSSAMDAVGNIGVAYSVSGPTTAPSIRFSGRSPADPADTLTVVEGELKAGEGSQSGVNRWGDYSSLSVDPTDDCTFWYTTEYYKAGDDNTSAWSTYIGSFKFDDCIAGPSGQIVGQVTSATDSTALANAQVTIGALTVTTDSEGNYVATLPVADDYAVAASKYGWVEGTSTGIDVAEDAEVTVNFTLDAATPIVVTGTVRDGSGLNTPLYSELVVNAPGTTITAYSDAVTGEYSLNLFEGTLVKITANALEVGYLPESFDVLPETTPEQDFNLTVLNSCTAAGYAFSIPSFAEDFEGGVPPTSWTIENTGASTETWKADVNGLLGTGTAVIIDSDAGGFSTTSGTLTSPSIQVADLASNNLEFRSWFRTFGGGDVYNVEISVDRGAWTAVQAMTATNTEENITVDLTASISGATEFQLRWNYQATFEWYALVDDVQIGGGVCQPQAGSIVKGIINDANTDLPLNGAMLTAGASSTLTKATPEDSNLADGYFRMFVADTETSINISANKYVAKDVDVAGISVDTPITLEAPLLEVADELPAVELTQGRTDESLVTIENTGNADGEFTFLLTTLPPAGQAKVTGPFHPTTRHFGPKALTAYDTKKIRYDADFTALNIAEKADVEVVGIFPVSQAFPWGLGINQDTGDFWVGDLLAGGAAVDGLYRYDSQGNPTTDSIDNTAISGSFAADVAYNNRTGMLWQVEVGNNNCIHELDPMNNTITGNQICPAFGTSQRGLAYDPLTDTFYSGSWNDTIIHQFTTDGTLLRSVNVGLAVAGLALNPVSNTLYVSVNGLDPAFDVVLLDAGVDTFPAISGFNYPKNQDFTGDGEPDDLLPDGIQSGLAIDCQGFLWTPSRTYGVVIGVNTGESDVCSWKELPWLEVVSGNSGMVAANSSAEATLGLSAEALQPGTYQAQLITSNNTPYGDNTSIVTLNVNAPAFGEIAFQVTNVEVNEEATATLTVERTDGSDFAVSVAYTTLNGTAVAGTDYTATSGTLEWADMDTAAKTITIPTSKLDVHKTFSVVLSEPTGGVTLGNNKATTVTILDKPKGGGSLGIALLALFALAGFSRRKQLKAA